MINLYHWPDMVSYSIKWKLKKKNKYDGHSGIHELLLDRSLLTASFYL